MIDWSKAPEGATHCIIEKNRVVWIKNDYSFWSIWSGGEWSAIGAPVGNLIERQVSERTKTITQAVFDGLPSEYRWAGVEASGKAYACICELIPKQTWLFAKDAKSAIRFVGDGYDTTNWQNSLIERQDVSNRVEQLRSIEEARQVEKDAVNNPSHYTTGGIECIDAMQAMLSRDEFIGYLRGNVFKYQWRYQHKNGIEDLKKAQWYANRLIELESAK